MQHIDLDGRYVAEWGDFDVVSHQRARWYADTRATIAVTSAA